MLSKSLYQKYHSKSRLQRRIISSKDFTYRNILGSINKFLVKGKKILDIGSATGTLSFYFASRGLIVDGIELSKNAYKFANLNKKNLNVKNINFLNISIEGYKVKNKYDIVTCFEVLEHLKNDVAILNKINTLMISKSILVVSVPSKNAPLYRMGLLDKFDKEVGHLRRYSTMEIRQKLSVTGFKVIRLVKSESILRNILYTNKIFSFIILLTRFDIVNEVISYLDHLFLKLFGESQLILICKKKNGK